MEHIYRIDHPQSYAHSWFLTVQWRGQVYHRHCTDSVYGGKRKALEAAKAYRDTLIAKLKPLTRSEYCRIKKKNNNRSGIAGITRIDAKESHRGKIRHRRYWLAQWPIGMASPDEEILHQAIRVTRGASIGMTGQASGANISHHTS